MFFCAYLFFLRDEVPFGRESGETGGNMITVVLITHMLWGLIMHAAAIVTNFSSGACKIQGVTLYSAIVIYAS
jgi:hypothetical protein